MAHLEFVCANSFHLTVYVPMQDIRLISVKFSDCIHKPFILINIIHLFNPIFQNRRNRLEEKVVSFYFSFNCVSSHR